MAIQDNEAVYDNQINPLMGQIIALCKEHGIPFVACFQLNDGDEESDSPLLCSSAYLPVGTTERVVRAYEITGPQTTWHLSMVVKQEG